MKQIGAIILVLALFLAAIVLQAQCLTIAVDSGMRFTSVACSQVAMKDIPERCRQRAVRTGRAVHCFVHSLQDRPKMKSIVVGSDTKDACVARILQIRDSQVVPLRLCVVNVSRYRCSPHVRTAIRIDGLEVSGVITSDTSSSNQFEESRGEVGSSRPVRFE